MQAPNRTYFLEQICGVRILQISCVGTSQTISLQTEHKQLSLDIKNKVFILASKDIRSAAQLQNKEIVFSITG